MDCRRGVIFKCPDPRCGCEFTVTREPPREERPWTPPICGCGAPMKSWSETVSWTEVFLDS
ncbi:MAG TPA: hypothetical protein VKW04_14915 [Planctomycetota bacterium]|nr:hypothetical protein [Planctomycetota bacterium]